MIAFHAGYLWGKSGMRTFAWIGLFLTLSLLFTAGVLDSAGTLDWIRFRMPTAYREEGFRLVRFTAGLFASLHAGMVHVPSSFRYRAYVAGDGIGKSRFLWSRLGTEAILLACVYLSFCALYVAVGAACSVRFDLDTAMIRRIACGGLFAFQIAAIAACLAFAFRSLLGVLPAMAVLAFTAEIRQAAEFANHPETAWLYRLLLAEVVFEHGAIGVYQPYVGAATLVASGLMLVLLYCLFDGEWTYLVV